MYPTQHSPPPSGPQQPSTGNWPPPVQSPPSKRHRLRKAVLVALAAFGAVAIAGTIAGIAGGTGTGPQPHVAAVSTPAATAPAVPPPPPAPSYTIPQQQAIASAESYLSDGQGFSKLGLIGQLSSAYGEGFSKPLAQFAVSHMEVNWRHQAVISARGYMTSQPGWSYSGLVDQLSSPYGENFTLGQARYAASAVGLR